MADSKLPTWSGASLLASPGDLYQPFLRYFSSAHMNHDRIAKIDWVVELTGFSRYQVRNLARRRIIPGAYQAQRGVQGSEWMFVKAKVLRWFENLTGA
jgi:hypothetical protein